MESRPVLTCDDVVGVVASVYGLRVTKQTTLNSYDDVNIRVLAEERCDNKFIKEVATDGYVLKILNSADSKKTAFIGMCVCVRVRVYVYVRVCVFYYLLSKKWYTI